MYPPRILFGFARKPMKVFGSPRKPKPGGSTGYPGRRSSRLSGSDPESRRMNSWTASGSRVPRIDAPLLIPIPPESGAFGPLSGKRLSATKYLRHLVS